MKSKNLILGLVSLLIAMLFSCNEEDISKDTSQYLKDSEILGTKSSIENMRSSALDVFYPSGSGWYVSYSGTTGWNKLNASTATKDQILLGDLNGDGKDDVFYPAINAHEGTGWYVSYGATSGWIKINASAASVNQVLLGNFN